MGTFGDWIQVFFLGLAWSAFMTFYAASTKPSVSLTKIALGYFVYGLSLGLLISIGWRALRMPAVFITVPCAGYGLFLLWSAKLASSSDRRNEIG